MAWIAITESHLLTAISGPELEALRAAALADGQADPVADVLSQVTERIRGDVAANASNVLGPTGQIPERLLSAALALIVWDIMRRPGASIIDDENQSRAKAVDRAEALLKRVADGTYAIEDPTTGEDQTNSAVTVVTKTTRQATRESLKGL